MSGFNRHTYRSSTVHVNASQSLLTTVCKAINPPVVKTSISRTCLNGHDRPD
jgi:hypothetical protein